MSGNQSRFHSWLDRSEALIQLSTTRTRDRGLGGHHRPASHGRWLGGRQDQDDAWLVGSGPLGARWSGYHPVVLREYIIGS